MYTVLLVVHSILVLFLILMVLIQRTDSDGLGGLGGGGSNQFLTGRGAANLLTRTTAILAGAFMVTSLVLAIMASRMTQSSILDAVPLESTAPMSKTSGKTDKPAGETPAKAKKETMEKDDATPAVPKPE